MGLWVAVQEKQRPAGTADPHAKRHARFEGDRVLPEALEQACLPCCVRPS